MLPLPFTISLLFLIIAFLTSKLQYTSTYLLVSIYALLGPIQTAAILLCTFSSVDSGHSQPIIRILFICSLATILLINLIGYIVQTRYLMLDRRFERWAKRRSRCDNYSCNWIWFHVISFLSFVTSYKLKMVLFSRLFNFECFKFQLQDVEKFKIFNVLSFIGYFPEILAMYCCIMVLAYEEVSLEQCLMFVDCLTIVVLNMFFSIAVIKKDSDFFQDQLEGVKLNKVYNTIQEINTNTALAEQKEREKRISKGAMALEDIVEVDQFAYTSTKRDRNKKKKSAKVKANEQSYYFQANSQQKTGSRIHTDQQRETDNQVGAAMPQGNQQQNILEVDQIYQQSTSVGQNEDAYKAAQSNEGGLSATHVIKNEVPLKCPSQYARPFSIYSMAVSVNIGLMEQQQPKVGHKKLSDYLLSFQGPQFKIIQEQVRSGNHQSDNSLANFILVDSSGLNYNEEPSIIQPTPQVSNYQRRMAKNMVTRVMSAHHSPNKHIRKDIQNDGESRTIISKLINQSYLNEEHDEMPIKNRSIDRLRRNRNHPIKSTQADHPLNTTNKQQQQFTEVEQKNKFKAHFIERRQLRKKLQQKKQFEYQNSLNPNSQTQNNFYQQYLHSKQDSSKQFKRTVPQSLALFSKKKNQNQSTLIAENYSTDNIPRQPRSIINLMDHSQSKISNFMLSRAFDRKKAIKFASKSGVRPQTSKNSRFNDLSLQGRSAASSVGKKMNSLQKIYLQKLYNQ